MGQFCQLALKTNKNVAKDMTSLIPHGTVLKAGERRLELRPSRSGLLAQISVECWEHDVVPSAGITQSDLSTEMVTEKKIKKKRSEGGEVTKTKKTKKNKKSDSEKENISVVSTSKRRTWTVLPMYSSPMASLVLTDS
uniref:Uncharacterized protein n=1 Tax=Timema shepardi TaxID=629360 RepID=A0A7R9FV60_TIMSH|nr:unnamed protein product [Timema shepardi]